MEALVRTPEFGFLISGSSGIRSLRRVQLALLPSVAPGLGLLVLDLPDIVSSENELVGVPDVAASIYDRHLGLGVSYKLSVSLIILRLLLFKRLG